MVWYLVIYHFTIDLFFIKFPFNDSFDFSMIFSFKFMLIKIRKYIESRKRVVFLGEFFLLLQALAEYL